LDRWFSFEEDSERFAVMPGSSFAAALERENEVVDDDNLRPPIGSKADFHEWFPVFSLQDNPGASRRKNPRDLLICRDRGSTNRSLSHWHRGTTSEWSQWMDFHAFLFLLLLAPSLMTDVVKPCE
jgi:hypothetical protein